MGFTVSIDSEDDTPEGNIVVTFTWDMNFNSAYEIVAYKTVVTMLSRITCPTSCPPSEPCQCNHIGSLAKEGENITISAVNCDDQEGPNTTIILRPQGLIVQ